MKINKAKTGMLLFGAALSVMGIQAGAFSAKKSPLSLSDTTKVDTAKQVADTYVSGKNTIDEVIWVVGDEPILLSEVEITKLQGEAEGMKWDGDPEYLVPEQIAVQKLFLHQAALDSISVSESEIAQGVEQQINYWISLPQIGSKEKLEEYQRKSVAQIRQDLHDDYKNRQLVQKMQEQLVSDLKVSPAEVRAYFKKLPADSIPTIPTRVEVEILTQTPKIEKEEVSRIKNQLRDYTDRVNKGETSFETLARLYSEDPGSARQGGELGFIGRAALDPAFAGAAFNLTDPKKLSKIVESEFGYHIIQLIDKRGDKINVRHILLKPKVSQASIDAAKARLDSIGNDIRAKKFTFEAAAAYVSDDKDTKNSQGLMVNSTASSRTSRFRMQDLPTEVARVVDTMKVDEISAPFTMANARGKVVCAIVKLKSRTPEHRASITEDFQEMKDIVLAERRKEVIHDWVVKKIKDTYVRMLPKYRNGKYQYEGWVR
ncbi:MAG: peptidylprolyl isomerase [Prevotella bivia]|uniref:Parvulin-like peptidyl-prolyl isomerase n=2 Tax=Prevotella bivia TaxID=28125 RepID=I4Z7A9_9BACT|nr:peptidylprolyl isomerase [Prevotella bivia]EFB92820.1 PPIC-type PPIASE domain protein [Prevotella bivia JCVIHMP010]EIM32101.1 parvulin-like peptidyl-prolyl isomerase [Prevotella bivia DSM 20514]KGF37242.1 peptidylprolyl isomerase [Prevotella bivia DNF00650]KGF44738.1 peptidylprolyl isomerase [Prevotella bivia DNF00320]KXU59198.1 PPIC-type PPIASE domain protein [Prevotella bivia]